MDRWGNELESDEESDYISENSMAQENEEDADPAGDYIPFIEALPECIPLTFGFHVVGLFPGDDEWCFCPCSGKMKTWRAQFGIDGEECDKLKFGPHPLLKHLEAMKDKSGCKFHEVVHIYLNFLFKDFLGKGIHHEAFYDLNSKPHKRALAMKKRKEHWYVLISNVSTFLHLSEQIDLIYFLFIYRIKVSLETSKEDLQKKLNEKEKKEEHTRKVLQMLLKVCIINSSFMIAVVHYLWLMFSETYSS